MKRLLKTFSIFSILALMMFAYTNCGEVNLQRTKDLESLAQGKSLGKLCTQTPPFLSSLNRYIFILDFTGSMSGVDPFDGTTTRRVQALRDIIAEYRQDDNFTLTIGALHNGQVGFLPDVTVGNGMMPTLNGQCTFLKPRIEEEGLLLDQAVAQLDVLGADTQGSSNFDPLFTGIQNCISTDRASQASAQYSVILVSDGAPTDLTPAEFKEKVRETVILGRDSGEEASDVSKVDMYFMMLDDLNANPDAASIMKDAVLAAQEVGGNNSRLLINADPGPISYEDLGIFRTRKYELKSLMVTNMNAVTDGTGTLVADSDGDGLPDRTETLLGSNPLVYASMSSCSDKLYFENNGTCAITCTPGSESLDIDHDGLSDCDELAVGTSPTNFDHDGDFIIDGLETRIGSSPMDPSDAASDGDLDGATVFKEAERQTSVFHDDSRKGEEEFADISVSQVESENGQNCYEVKVENIPLFDTKASNNSILSLHHGKGQNVIKVTFLQVVKDNPTVPPIMLYGYKTLDFNEFNQGRGLISELQDRDLNFYRPETSQ